LNITQQLQLVALGLVVTAQACVCRMSAGGATDWSGCWDFLPAGSTKSFYDSADEGPGLGAESGMASATTVDYQNSGSDASDAGSGDEGQEENMGSLATLDMPGDGPVKLADGLAGFVLSGLDIRTSAMQADRAKVSGACYTINRGTRQPGPAVLCMP
jgi:hypothetical protein